MTDKKPSPIDPRSEVLKMLERNAEREALVEAVVKAARGIECVGFGLWDGIGEMRDALAALDRFDAGEGR